MELNALLFDQVKAAGNLLSTHAITGDHRRADAIGPVWVTAEVDLAIRTGDRKVWTVAL